MNTTLKSLLTVALLGGVMVVNAADEKKAKAPKPYPMETCVVSGEKLDSMGEPVTTVYNGQQVKFCCESCIDDFKKEPAKFIAKLTEAK